MSSNQSTVKKAGPWVGEDRSKREPLPPVNEFDDRPATKDIIEQHATTIEEIRKKLADDPLYDPIKHDDLWIVRYVLSHKKVDKAAAAAKKFMLYRKERCLDDADIRSSPPGKDCPNEGIRKFYDCIEDDAMIFSNPDPNRGVVLFMRLAGHNQDEIAKISDDDWAFWYVLEWMFQVLDSVTRRTGRLTKGIRFIDLEGYSLSQNNKECIDRNSRNARECQDHYPQMLASVYLINAPTWSHIIFRIAKPLLPKRFVEKFSIINPKKNKKEAQKLLQHVSADHLPMKFGGEFQEWPYPTRLTV